MASYKSILIYYKKMNSQARDLARLISRWLDGLQIHNEVLEGRSDFAADQFDCVLALGGDGTILSLARKLAGTRIPILGVNFGAVGYLTMVRPEHWQKALENLLAGNMKAFGFMALKWRIIRGGEIIHQGPATNDVVLSRCFPARLISLNIKINDFPMGVLRGDGLIISTPLGSPGYCISAGGPVMLRQMNAMAMVPICPFPAGVRPMVFPADARLEFTVNPANCECHATIDGQEWHKLSEGDIISVGGWPDSLVFFGDEKVMYRHLLNRGLPLENSALKSESENAKV